MNRITTCLPSTDASTGNGRTLILVKASLAKLSTFCTPCAKLALVCCMTLGKLTVQSQQPECIQTQHPTTTTHVLVAQPAAARLLEAVEGRQHGELLHDAVLDLRVVQEHLPHG